jgi:hypothetical protein
MESYDIRGAYVDGGFDAWTDLTSYTEHHASLATGLLIVLTLVVLYFLFCMWRKGQAFTREFFASREFFGAPMDVGLTITQATGETGPVFFGPNLIPAQQLESGLGTQRFAAKPEQGARVQCGDTLSNADPRAWMLKHYNDADPGVQTFLTPNYETPTLAGSPFSNENIFRAGVGL